MYARSPAAFKTLHDFKHLRLPAVKTVEEQMGQARQGPGMEETLIELFDRQVEKARAEAQDVDEQNFVDIALYWDEVNQSLLLAWP